MRFLFLRENSEIPDLNRAFFKAIFNLFYLSDFDEFRRFFSNPDFIRVIIISRNNSHVFFFENLKAIKIKAKLKTRDFGGANIFLNIITGILPAASAALLCICMTGSGRQMDDLTALNKLKGQKLGIPVKLPPFDPERDVPAAPDYSSSDCWVFLPDYFSREKMPVDVFFVYPTILSDDKTYIMDIRDPKLREKAGWTIVEQASIFDGQANIYAPYYRQNNVKINPLMLADAKPIFSLGQNDLIRAFDYFLKNFNKGERPIILAAHSQGSVRVVELSKAGELLTGDSESLKRLVCAYTIGYSITPSDLRINPLMRISENATDTGCFVAYNTISDEKDKEKEGPTIIPGTFVVNPLNWRTDSEFAPASLNTEACFFKHEHPKTPDCYPNFAAAQIIGNALVITDISNPEELPATSVTFPKGVYHMYDYAIFYGNLRKNVADRIEAYMKKNELY